MDVYSILHIDFKYEIIGANYNNLIKTESKEVKHVKLLKKVIKKNMSINRVPVICSTCRNTSRSFPHS